jgi:hypothetical protein
MKAIQIQAFGKPADGAQCVDIADVGAPDTNEVVVALEASPINQYDLLMIAGGYGYRPPLPASFSRNRRSVASGFSTGTSQPSRTRSRRCSIIWRRQSLPARSRPQLPRPTG